MGTIEHAFCAVASSGPFGPGQLLQQLDLGWALIATTLMGGPGARHEPTDTETHKYSHCVAPWAPSVLR